MRTRVLCLGNDLMADDAVGPEVARRLRDLDLPGVEVIESAESGLRLLEHLDGARLIVVDAVSTGSEPPGTIYVLNPDLLSCAPVTSPHYTGLHEALLLGRALGMSVPGDVTIVAVETADCRTVGGPMCSEVKRAAMRVVDLICKEVVLPSPSTAVTTPV